MRDDLYALPTSVSNMVGNLVMLAYGVHNSVTFESSNGIRLRPCIFVLCMIQTQLQTCLVSALYHARVSLDTVLQVIVTDTAGMRQTLDPIEAEGVAVAHETAQQADVVLYVLDCATWLKSNVDSLSGISHWELGTHDFQKAVREHPNALTVLNKADALTEQQLQQLQKQLQQQQEQQLGREQQQTQQQQLQNDVQQETQRQQLQNDVQQETQQQQQQQQQQPSDGHIQQKGMGGQQQHQLDSSQPPGSYNDVLLAECNGQDSTKQAGMEAAQLQSMHSMRTVLCSCKSGWNMDVLVRALEQGVQAIMQSGQESEEALVITRYTLPVVAEAPLVVLCGSLQVQMHSLVLGRRLVTGCSTVLHNSVLNLVCLLQMYLIAAASNESAGFRLLCQHQQGSFAPIQLMYHQASKSAYLIIQCMRTQHHPSVVQVLTMLRLSVVVKSADLLGRLMLRSTNPPIPKPPNPPPSCCTCLPRCVCLLVLLFEQVRR